MSTGYLVPTHRKLKKQLKKTWKTAGALAVPGLLLCSAVSAGPIRHEQHFKVAAHPIITIHNPEGLITVKAWTKAEVMVISMPASTAVEVDAEQMGNRVDVSTRALSDSVAPGDMKADFQINVPEDAELQIHNDAGSVNVSNVTGDMNVETVAAGVDLEDTSGYLTVKTVGALRRSNRGFLDQRQFQVDRFEEYSCMGPNLDRQYSVQWSIFAQRNLFVEEL